MTDFFTELRQAREAKQLSLADISDATLINVRFLEAIEAGNTSILPQTYVRAFIREFAGVVGLDPVETLRKYEEATGAAPPPSTPPSPEPARPAPAAMERSVPKEPSTRGTISPRTARVAIVLVFLSAAAIGIWNLTSREPSTLTVERPLDDTSPVAHMSTLVPAPPAPPASREDSLTLGAEISDTVWVNLLIDGQHVQEYLFRPGRQMEWRAKEKFIITLGNAGAVSFTLDGRPLGTLGKRGAVVRNVEITRQFQHDTTSPAQR
jgi:cytoskeletal protein RodZ